MKIRLDSESYPSIISLYFQHKFYWYHKKHHLTFTSMQSWVKMTLYTPLNSNISCTSGKFPMKFQEFLKLYKIHVWCEFHKNWLVIYQVIINQIWILPIYHPWVFLDPDFSFFKKAWVLKYPQMIDRNINFFPKCCGSL